MSGIGPSSRAIYRPVEVKQVGLGGFTNASLVLAAGNGQYVTGLLLPDEGKWSLIAAAAEF